MSPGGKVGIPQRERWEKNGKEREMYRDRDSKREGCGLEKGKAGIPRRGKIGNSKREREGNIIYYCTDLYWYGPSFL